MKKILALILALVMCFSLVACGGGSDSGSDDGAAETKYLKVAFNQTATNPECQTLEWMSDKLYEATEGRYALEVYPDAQLGSQEETLEQVTMGVLDMALVANSVIESYAPDMAILGTPYVYDSYEHQQKVFESGVLADVFATTEAHGFTVLAAYSLGARNVYTSEKPISTPADLAGMQLRVMGSQTCIDMMNAMGGEGLHMPQGDVYSAIQTGTIDGAENNIITYVDLVQYEVAKYYNYTNHLMVPDELVISNNVLASMSAEDQEALKKIATESITYCFDTINEQRAEYEAIATEKGVIFTEADVPAFQAACADLINAVANKSDMSKAAYEAILSQR